MAKKIDNPNRVIREFFEQMNICAEAGPDEDRCAQLLDGIYQVARSLVDPVVVSNFELHWHEFYQKIKIFCLPSDLEFYRARIELWLNKILDSQRASI